MSEIPSSNDQTPRYQCFADGCPANHASKWQVCTLPDDDPLVRVRFLLYTQFIFGTGLTDLQAQILEAAMREIENLRKGHETKPQLSICPATEPPAPHQLGGACIYCGVPEALLDRSPLFESAPKASPKGCWACEAGWPKDGRMHWKGGNSTVCSAENGRPDANG